MVNKNSLKSSISQALKIRKPLLTLKFYKIYHFELLKLKNSNIILDYKIINRKLTILINLNAKIF